MSWAGGIYTGVTDQLTNIQATVLSGNALALTGVQGLSGEDEARLSSSFFNSLTQSNVYDIAQVYFGPPPAPPENTFSLTSSPTAAFARADALVGASYATADGNIVVSPQVKLVAEAYDTGGIAPNVGSLAQVGASALIEFDTDFTVRGVPTQVQISFNYLVSVDVSVAAGSQDVMTQSVSSLLVGLYSEVSNKYLLFTNPPGVEFGETPSLPGNDPMTMQGTYQSPVFTLPPGNYQVLIEASSVTDSTEFVPEPSSAIPAGIAVLCGVVVAWRRRRR
jgi:hypothetical protein